MVCHTSVLYQVPPDGRERFARTVRDLGAVWLSSEEPGDVPGTAAAGLPPAAVAAAGGGFACVVARDGRPLAVADSHGAWLHWLG